jgi:ubiquinone/menaquinone biosynthesis C-methylase UbiE
MRNEHTTTKSIRTRITQKWESYIDRQYRQPSGPVGIFIGRRMTRQHEAENNWTITLLDVRPEDHILEIGFGAGATIAKIVSKAYNGHISGIDFSPTMVALAHRRNISAIRNRLVDLRDGEINAIPYENSSFDKAFSIHTLYFWSDPQQALHEVLRVLKPGGTFTLTFLAKENWPGMEAATINGVYSGQEVVELLLAAGFAHAHIESGPNNKTFREIAVIGKK